MQQQIVPNPSVKLENGDVILYGGTSLLARTIKFLTGFRYNHAAIYFDGAIYEALEYGVQMSSLESGFADAKEFAVLRYNKPELLNKTQVRQQLNLIISKKTKYDYKTLLVFQFIYQVTGLWVGKSDSRRVTCTELVARCYLGDKLPVDPDQVTCKDLFYSSYFDVVYEQDSDGVKFYEKGKS